MTLAFVEDPAGSALRVAVEETIGHKVRLDYFFCRCGNLQRPKQGHCSSCGAEVSQGFLGFRAIWEFTYGEWTGIPTSFPSVQNRAIDALDQWRKGPLRPRGLIEA